MRYSYTTLALALATATQVAAQPNRHAARHGHAAFHAKKDAEKRDLSDVDWSEALAGVDWDSALSNVDWSTVDYTYSSGQSYGQSTQAAAAPVATPATTTPAAHAVAHISTAAAVAATTEAPSTTLATSTTSVSTAAAVESSSSSSNSLVDDVLNLVQEAELLAFGVIAAGLNAVTDTEDVWIGDDGDYTMDITNNREDPLYLVAWGPEGSWINANVPLVTLYVPSGGSKTLSFKNGASGALSALGNGISLVNGQVSNTWIEYTMQNDGVFDVSREVNMKGHNVEVVGPECTSNMTTCVFQCTDTSVTSCEYDYELLNCATGSQSGAQFGTYDGAASGGCGGLGSSAAMAATFS